MVQALPIMAVGKSPFAIYLQAIPGAFALIGSNGWQRTMTFSCHSPILRSCNDRTGYA